MSDIFLSYAREDRERAKSVVSALESKGWSVFWDQKIVPGQTWDQVLQKELDAARCVIVLWSRDSVQSEGVTNEVHEGKRRDIFVPGLIDDLPAESIPLWFRRIQAANLVGWQGKQPHAGFDDLTRAVEAVLAKPVARRADAAAAATVAAAEVRSTERVEDLRQAQAPTITSLNPPSVPVGSGQFTLVVAGTNLQAGCYATWNNQPLITNFVNSMEVDATVPSSFPTLVQTAYIGVTFGSAQSNLIAFGVTGSNSLNITTFLNLPQATAFDFYSVTLQASGGSLPYRWSALTAIPAGLTLTLAGILSGTPIEVGEYALEIQVTDSSSPTQTASQSFRLTIERELS